MTQAYQIVDKRKRRWEARVEMDIFRLSGLTTYEKIVYAVLCGFADKDGTAFPTVKRIADMASCSPSQVRKSLAGLEKCTLVVRKAQTGPGGQTSNMYEIFGIEAYTGADAPAPPLDLSEVEEDEPDTVHVGEGGRSVVEGGAPQGGGGPSTTRRGIHKQLHITAPNNNTSSPAGDGEPDLVLEVEPKKQKNNPLEEWFEKFYKAYPRKVDRKDAKKAFDQIFARASPEKQRAMMENLILYLTAYVGEVSGWEKKYIKHPAVWLRKNDFEVKPEPEEMATEERWEAV